MDVELIYIVKQLYADVTIYFSEISYFCYTKSNAGPENHKWIVSEQKE